ncbi:putative Phagocyte signaling-impaired protein [Danaus plexippus plexippus]|uniref:N-terminal acetyltransferase B complex subunit MDM20 homolog n=1 Tax=Danaus plexippus plexippus TaxID=278856 RepID=A0A212FMR7_DANPL|nr:putative Phagocyte signaling-impaired protein [Danaus plexippus plexippus]
MAVRPQNTHDGGIVERRLRPIYDWLDNGNNKKAFQEAEKVLKKSPSLQAARALKALALFRLGKGAEAQTVLETLAQEKPCDDTTLQAMTISYRESQQFHKVCALYEAAVKVEPTSEELYSHLFMSYVRVGDFRSQQRVAMALYKFAPKNPYYFWAVMSILLQAKTTDDPTKKGILLTLAQRMVDNFISENKMEAEQEARLYVMILELQEKWTDILRFIEGPLYSQLVPGSTAQASIPYLKKLSDWRRLNLVCKELLFDNQDRWDYYLPYLDSVFKLMDNTDSDNDNSVDDTAEKCHEFICQLVESMTSGRTLRGPYLARLELWKRLSVHGDPTTLLGSGVALCIQYLRVFANKPCAVPDLKPYLAIIPQKEREEHCRDFLTCLGFDENSEPESPDDIQRHISCLCAWQLTSPVRTGEDYLNIASLLRYQYLRCANKKLITATLTEFCAADGYGTLAAHFYFYAAVKQQSATPILEALSLLELVLHNSPSNFHAKLLLITLYHVLGNGPAADSVYRRLEAKHVQLLSLGWIHAARLAPGLAHTRALRLLADTHAFHKHHGKDCMEHLTYAYKYGTFEKLLELREWGARLEACAWCSLAGRERALLPLLAGPTAPMHAPHPLPDPLTDNRDLNAIVSWEQPQYNDPGMKERSFDHDVAYLRLKDGIVSCIALCIECADNRSLDEKKVQLDEMQTCIEAFSSAMEKCKEKYSGKQRLCLSAPFPSRIIAFVNSPVPYRELYVLMVSVVRSVCAGDGLASRDRGTALRPLLAASREHLAAAVHTDLWAQRDTLEFFSNYLEFVGVITFLLGVCNEVTAQNNKKKSKRKTNQSPDQILTNQMLSVLNDDVQDIVSFLEEIFDNWPSFDYNNSLEEQMTKLDINDKYQCPVKQKLKDGIQEIVADVKTMLKKKSKYLKSLQ